MFAKKTALNKKAGNHLWKRMTVMFLSIVLTVGMILGGALV